MNNNTLILEGSKTEASLTTKVENNQEQELAKDSIQNSSLSSYSSSEAGNSERGGCPHKKTVFQENYDNCFHCGAFLSKVYSLVSFY